MVLIDQREKKFIASKMPKAHIRRTVANKSKRHRYYLEEDHRALALLNSFRQSNSLCEKH